MVRHMALISKKDFDRKVRQGHIKQENITNLIYTDKDGVEKVIVREKQANRPIKTMHHRKEWWPEKKKIEAATLHVATGNVVRTAELTKVPVATIRKWVGEDWWLEVQSRIRREEGQEMDRKFSTIVNKSLDKLEERVQEGDYVYNYKSGKV